MEFNIYGLFSNDFSFLLPDCTVWAIKTSLSAQSSSNVCKSLSGWYQNDFGDHGLQLSTCYYSSPVINKKN